MGGKPLTKEEIEKMKEQRRGGKTIRDIALIFGRSIPTVHKIVKNVEVLKNEKDEKGEEDLTKKAVSEQLKFLANEVARLSLEYLKDLIRTGEETNELIEAYKTLQIKKLYQAKKEAERKAIFYKILAVFLAQGRIDKQKFARLVLIAESDGEDLNKELIRIVLTSREREDPIVTVYKLSMLKDLIGKKPEGEVDLNKLLQFIAFRSAIQPQPAPTTIDPNLLLVLTKSGDSAKTSEFIQAYLQQQAQALQQQAQFNQQLITMVFW